MRITITPEDFAILFQRYLENRCTPEETAQLISLCDEPAFRQLALDLMEASMRNDVAPELQASADVRERLGARLEAILAPKARSITMLRWAAAAVLLLVAGTAAYFMLQQQTSAPVTAQVIQVQAPSKNRATITLGDGRTIYLDSANNGALAEQNGVVLQKLADGQVAYKGESNHLQYNTLSNPMGSRPIDMTLSDGSHVWLNAGSSVTYPVAFVGGERRVTMDGEAYFEVAHDASRPFTVAKGYTAVQVLGTHFNVKAYGNEPDLRITLLEGKVRVASGSQTKILEPSQQAILSNGKIALNDAPNINDVMAWRQGYTSFHGVDMRVILRELERWYDIRTEMKTEVPANRVIHAPRDIPLQDMLKTLLDDNGIKYEYNSQEKKLTILP